MKKELSIFTFKDLLELFPYRHVDKTRISLVKEITPQTDFIQVAGILVNAEVIGDKRAKRLVAHLKDKTGLLELTWFQSIPWIQKSLKLGEPYLVYGKVSFFGSKPQIVHPEMDLLADVQKEAKKFEPVYPSTEKLKSRGLGGRQIGKLTQVLFSLLHETNTMPEKINKAAVRTKRFLMIQD